MATNLHIDDALIAKAVKLGGHKSKREAVTQAQMEYVNHLEQQKILSLFGTIDYDPKFKYKDQRSFFKS